MENLLRTAITQKLLRRKTLKDLMMQLLVEDIKTEECRTALHRYIHMFHDLTAVDQIVMWEL
jgi:hypothetical protein